MDVTRKAAAKAVPSSKRAGRSVERRHRPNLALLAASVTLAGTLASCSSAASSPTKSASTKATTNSGISQTPVSGGTLTVAMSAAPSTLDWGFSTAAVTREVAWNIFETPFAADANYNIRPMLASGYTRSPNGLTYTINLRSNVHFQNGQTMTAQDVVASIERWMKLSGTGQLAAESITSITTSAPLTVTVTLKSPFDLPAAMAGGNQACIILPAAIAKAAMTTPLTNSELIGTGPYQFSSETPGQQVVLKRFQDYSALPKTDNWGGDAGYKPAYIKTIKFDFITSESTRLSGLLTGQYNFADTLTTSDYSQIASTSGVKPVLITDADQQLAILNPNKSPFNNLQMREALNYATNKQALASAGDGQPKYYDLNPSIYLPSQKLLYSNAGNTTYETQNLQQAKALIKASGYNTSQPIVLQTTQDYASSYRATVALAQEMNSVGLKTNVVVNDSSAMFAAVDNPKDWDIWVVSFVPYFAPNLELFLQPGYLNHYSDPTLEQLFADYNAATSTTAQRQIAVQIQQFVWQQVPIIKLFDENVLDGSSQNLNGFTPYFTDIFWNTWLS